MTHGQLSIGQFVVPFEITKKLYLHYDWHVFCTSSIFSVWLIHRYPFVLSECTHSLWAVHPQGRQASALCPWIKCWISRPKGTWAPTVITCEYWMTSLQCTKDLVLYWTQLYMNIEVNLTILQIWRRPDLLNLEMCHLVTLLHTFIAACLTSRQKLVRVDYISLLSDAILPVNQWMALEVANHIQHSPASTLFSF